MNPSQETTFGNIWTLLCLLVIISLLSRGNGEITRVQFSEEVTVTTTTTTTEEPNKNYVDVINSGTFSEIQNSPDLRNIEDDWSSDERRMREEQEERDREWDASYGHSVIEERQNTKAKNRERNLKIVGVVILCGGVLICFAIILSRIRGRSMGGHVYQPAVGEIRSFYPSEQITIPCNPYHNYPGEMQIPIQSQQRCGFIPTPSPSQTFPQSEQKRSQYTPLQTEIRNGDLRLSSKKIPGPTC